MILSLEPAKVSRKRESIEKPAICIESEYARYIEDTNTWYNIRFHELQPSLENAVHLANKLGGVAMKYGLITADNGVSGFAWFPCVDKRKAIAAGA